MDEPHVIADLVKCGYAVFILIRLQEQSQKMKMCPSHREKTTQSEPK